MDETTVIGKPAGAVSKSLNMRVLLAFFVIYVLWGTTFLAIRIAVEEVPPLFAAGTRFFIAGVVLYGFMRIHGTRGQVHPNGAASPSSGCSCSSPSTVRYSGPKNTC